MANIKKLNGYDIIDSNFAKVTPTINSLTLDEEGVAGTNNVNITLPSGWNSNNTFIIGGYYTVYDTNNDIVVVRQINSTLTDGSTGEANFINEVGYYDNNGNNVLYCDIINYISAWVDYKVIFTLLLYNKN